LIRAPEIKPPARNETKIRDNGLRQDRSGQTFVGHTGRFHARDFRLAFPVHRGADCRADGVRGLPVDLAAVAICAITEVMPSSAPTPITDDQISRLVQAFRGARSEFAPVLEAVGATSIGAMTSSQAVRAMSWLQRKRARPEHEQAEA
jgi:hypothetical protein